MKKVLIKSISFALRTIIVEYKVNKKESNESKIASGYRQNFIIRLFSFAATIIPNSGNNEK